MHIEWAQQPRPALGDSSRRGGVISARKIPLSSVSRSTASPMHNSALFLDRDGVINVDRGHVHRPEQFEFVPGIFPSARFWPG